MPLSLYSRAKLPCLPSIVTPALPLFHHNSSPFLLLVSTLRFSLAATICIQYLTVQLVARSSSSNHKLLLQVVEK